MADPNQSKRKETVALNDYKYFSVTLVICQIYEHGVKCQDKAKLV